MLEDSPFLAPKKPHNENTNVLSTPHDRQIHGSFIPSRDRDSAPHRACAVPASLYFHWPGHQTSQS